MYKEDCLAINEWIDFDVDRLRRMMTFVVLTIRVKFHKVKPMMEDVDKNRLMSNALWGFKSKAYDSIHSSDNTRELKNILETGSTTNQNTEYCMDILKDKFVGFGNAKAGFVLQMLGHDVACLDVHNLKALGIKDVRTTSSLDYIKLCQMNGTSEWWWNRWCEYIGNSNNFEDAESVSKFHVDCIIQ